MPEKILVRTTNWVGDAVMSMPALAAVRDNFPKARIAVLARPPLTELYENNPAVDDIIPFDATVYKGTRGLAKLARVLKREKFDRAILLQNAFKAALIAYLAKIPVRMGYNTDGRSMLLTHGVSVSRAVKERHQVYYYLEMLRSLGMKVPDDPRPALYPDDTSAEEADGMLLSGGISSSDNIVGINPGAQYGVAKKWFPERFADVSDMLVWKYGVKVVIFGGPGDVDAACAVEAAMDEPCVNLAGRTNLKQLMALLARCRLFITNDTGSMHVSAALGTPTLAVFGSTDHIATGPFGEGHAVVRDPVYCSPCLKRKCPLKHYRCLENVSVEMVYNEARRMLGGG